MRWLSIIVGVLALLAVCTLLVVGQRPGAGSATPSTSSSSGAGGIPVIQINPAFTWITDRAVADLTDVSVVYIGDRARIYNTRGEWVPCTLGFFDTERKGLGVTRLDLPPFGAVSAPVPATDRTIGFMQITIPMGRCDYDPDGGPHVIGIGSDPLSIPLLREWGFLTGGAKCPTSAILQDAPDISPGNFTMIVVGESVSYSTPHIADPATPLDSVEADRLRIAIEMIEKVRADDAAIASGAIPAPTTMPAPGTPPAGGAMPQ